MAGRKRVVTHDDGPLVLHTLGGTVLVRPIAGNGSPPLLGPGKPLALLVYLACSPERTAGRDHLCDLLWADLEPDAARHTLRQTVWYLRQRLGTDALTLERESQLTLRASLTSDRDAFLSAIEQGDLESAVKLYTGDFVPDYAAPGGAEFEQWADLERFRLRLQFLRAGEQAVRRWLSQARFRDAQQLARRLRDADPARESSWRLLLESLLSGGDRLGASIEVEALKRMLGSEDREPEPATRSVVREVGDETLDASPQADRARHLVAELVGRGKEFAAIMEAWDAARLGTGQHLHIRGAAGIGKTRLLEDVSVRLRAQGAQVLLVRAKPGERQIEYGFASDLAAALCSQAGSAGISPSTAATLVALNPALSSRFAVQPDRAAGPEALRRRSIALCETLAVVSDDHPLALLLDDLHWSDPASRRVLQVVLDRLPRHPVLVLTAARPGVEETGGEGSEAISLEPLLLEDVGAFVASLGQLPDEPWAARLPGLLHHATGGIPLLVLDSLEWLLQRMLLQRTETGWTCPDPRAIEMELAAGSALRRRIAALERKPGWILVLLAVVGTPLRVEQVAAMAGLLLAETEEALATLELRGLARRRAEVWEPAHDAIAESAQAQASGEAIRAANASVGRVLAQRAADDPQALFKAARHLAMGGEDEVLGDVFQRWVQLVRRQGERRSNRDLAGDILGNGRTGNRVQRLVKTLPLHVRAGLIGGRRIAMVAAVPLLVVAIASAFLFRSPKPPPDAVLVLYYTGSGDSIPAVAVPLRLDGWDRFHPIDVARNGVPYPRVARAGNRGDLVSSPDGKMWVSARLVAESSAYKLFVIGADGKSREVTDSIRDDQDASWSPDSRHLVFSSARWNANRWGDIATLDLASGRVRRLTSEPRTESNAKWSPDGTRIAFALETHDSPRPRICWTTPAGAPPVCLPVDRSWLIGWYDSDQLLIRYDSARQSFAVRYDITTYEQHELWRGKPTDEVQISDDRRWIACRCQPQGYDQPGWFVFPADRPDLARHLDMGSFGQGQRILTAWVGNRPPPYIARLEIQPPRDTIPWGSDFRLRVQGRDTSGELSPVPVITWYSSDTAIATIDRSTGVVHPVGEGVVTIVATAGGWRHAQRRFIVAPQMAQPVLSETWVDMERWVPFGNPRPILTTGPQGVRAFLNNGDGWNHSGAHSRQGFRARDGLGLEARLSTPIVGPRQQFIILRLAAWADAAALARMDSSVNNQPGPQTTCEVTYPAETGDNPATRGDMMFRGGRFRLSPSLRSGAWYTVRLQLFPDGRCGVAVNGTALAVDEAALPLDLPYHAVLEGNSFKSRILVGPVEVWEGVRGGVDWSMTRPPATDQHVHPGNAMRHSQSQRHLDPEPTR